VHKNTLVIVKCQIRKTENPTPAIVISVDAARVADAILLAYLASEVALEEPEIRRSDPNILIDNNCTDHELHFGMPRVSGAQKDQGDDRDKCDAIPSASLRRCPATELARFDLGTSDVD